MKKKIILIVSILLIILLFVEIFIYKFINLPFSFQILSHSENRTDFLTFLGIIVSSTISISVYLLSKKIDEQNHLERERKRYKAICIVYDYLSDSIVFIKKKLFFEREDYFDLKYKKEFLKSVFALNNDLFDQDDIELLRSLDKTINNFIDSKNDLAIKWVLKSMFDLNMPFSKLKEINNIVDDDLLLNTRLVRIIAKLKREMNYNYEKNIEYNDLKLSIKFTNNTIVVEKKYGDRFRVCNGIGYVRVYEPIFIKNPNMIINENLLYEGSIKNYMFNGKGKYYYYIKDNSKYFIDSYALIEPNAKKISKTLENNGLDKKVCLTINGVFENGVILEGTIESENEKYNQINI